MTTSKRRRNGKAPQEHEPGVEHLTPDRVTDIAYCFYVVMSNHHTENSPDIALSKRIVDEFNRLYDSFSRDSPEGVFLFTVSQIIISLSRGIARCKQNKLARLKAAEEAKAERLKLISESSRRAGFIRASIRTAIMGGFGYAAVESLMPALSPHLHSSDPSDARYISLATALGLVLLSSYVTAWWTSVKVTRIFMYHQFVISYAEKEYDAAALEEYERADQSSRRYSNTPAASWPNYATQIREERRVRESFEEKYLTMISDPVTIAVDLFKKPFTALGRVRLWRSGRGSGSA
ncbi:MAG: hypothetical protein HZB26_00825 [Candidatus Hydrogenedentes bacterium]|nr:hypothetical protein [Candidatus Hydrogenedentota bacterium]